MNTPNPNPSPELIERLQTRLTAYLSGDRRDDRNWPLVIDAGDLAAIVAALSPQMGAKQYNHEDRVTALAITLSAIAAEAKEEHGEWTWREIATAAMNILWCRPGQSLTTVAAANDEGVAEQAAQFADGVAEGAQSLYDLAARDRDTVGTLIHGEAIRVAKHIAAAIRLLSQGGGKA